MPQGDYIKAEHCRVTVPGRLRYFTITVFALLTLVGAGFQRASAQTSGQPATTDSKPVSTVTNTLQNQSSAAGEKPVTKPTSTDSNLVSTATDTSMKKPEPKMNPCATAEVEGTTWLDQTHDFVDKRLCEPAVWFDSFFCQDRTLEDVPPGAFVKWRNSGR